jgi:hypothetical protein
VTNLDLTQPAAAYPPMTPTEAAEELGVPLSERLQPNLRDFRPKRFVPLEEAKSRGWSWCFPGDVCRYAHVAARRTANTRICSDCERVKGGEEPIYGRSRAQQFYPEERIARKDPSTGIVTAAPALAALVSPSKALEPSKKEQDFLASLDELRDFDAAAKRAGMTRGQVEARASSDPVFKAALTDLCDRRSIPWTRAPAPEAFAWTPAIESQLVKRFIDTGLIEQARQELAVSASDYQEHLSASPEFSGAIAKAMPLARATLRERAEASADRGNDRLLKLLLDEIADDDRFITLSNGQRAPRPVNPQAAREELTKILADIEKRLAREDALERVARARGATSESDDTTAASAADIN